MSDASWSLIESDPGVFTELMQNIGAKDIMCEEVYDLGFENVSTAYGLIFLFKWRAGEPDHGQDSVDNVFFANQVITNACATQAILSILMNADSHIDIGDTLKNFKNFTKDFPGEMKGIALSNEETIRAVHNSFAKQEMYTIEDNKKDSGDAFHFISYVPIDGRLYELDGLKRGPVDLGPCAAGDAWLQSARTVLEERIRKYQQSEIRFNLMAVVKDRRVECREQMAALAANIKSEPEGSALIDALNQEIKNYERRLAIEDKKFADWKAANVRRKHNYTPFIMQMFKLLAKDGRLQSLVDSAKEKAAAKRQRV